MAFSYLTGSANGQQDLLDQLSAFLQTAGWSLVDTITAGDLVFSSTGTSGNEALFYRFILAREPGNPFKWERHYWNDGLIVLGYTSWDTNTHTGTLEYGRWGPMAVWRTGSSGVRAYPIPADPNQVAARSCEFAMETGSARFLTAFDGQRYMVLVLTGLDSVEWRDLMTGEAFTTPQPANWNANSATQGHRVDADGNEVYYFPTSGQAAFWSYNLTTDTWTLLANPPAAWASNSGCRCVYDGVDALYCHKGYNTTDFWKYTISTDSWTVLAPCLSPRTNVQTGAFQTYYIPTHITGLDHDVVLCFRQSSATADVYNVSTDTWSTITLSKATENTTSTTFLFDNNRYIYYASLSSATQWGRLDLSDMSSDTIWQLNDYSQQMCGTAYVAPPAGAVKVHPTLATTFYVLASKDFIFLGTLENNRVHWLHAGMYDGYYPSRLATLAAPATAGFAQTVQVDDSSKLSAGDLLFIGGASPEQVSVQAVVDATHVTVNLTAAHETGAPLAVDAEPYAITGGNGLACTPLDARGRRTHNMDASWRITPAIKTSNLSNAVNSGRGGIQLVPLLLGQDAINLDSHKDNLGALKGVFALPRNGGISFNQGDTLTIQGKTYVVLLPYLNTLLSSSADNGYAIAYGPTN